MATYTVGNATWTNGSHKQVFTAVAPRPAVFLTCFDVNAGAGYAYLATTVNGSGYTTANNIVGPSGTYNTKDTYNREVTVTGTGVTAVQLGIGGAQSPQGGDGYTGYVVSGGATRLVMQLRTTGCNSAGEWTAKIRPTAGSDTGAMTVVLPAIPDNTWTSVVLNLPSSFTTTINQLLIYPTGGNFAVGDKIVVTSAFICNANTAAILFSDKLSPDGGTTQAQVDLVVNTSSGSGTLYNTYTATAYAGTTGSYSTTRIEAATGVTLTATIPDVGTLAGTASVDRKLTSSAGGTNGVTATFTRTTGFISSVNGANTTTAGTPRVARGLNSTTTAISTVSTPTFTKLKNIIGAIAASVTSSATLTGNRALNSVISGVNSVSAVLNQSKLFTSVVNGISAIVNSGFNGSVPPAPVYVIGNANWVSGSNVISFLDANPNVVVFGDTYPYTYPTTGGGIQGHGTWGTNGGVGEYTAGVGIPGYTYGVPYASADPTVSSNAFAFWATGYPAMADQNISGFTTINLKMKFSGNTSAGWFSINLDPTRDSTMGDGTAPPRLPAVQIPNTPNNTWANVVVPMPISAATIGEVAVFHTIEGNYYVETMAIDSIFFSNDSQQTIRLDDKISPDGGATKFTIKKVLQRSNGTIDLVLDTTYAGTTGTYSTTRTLAVPWGATLAGTSQVNSAVGFVRRMIATVANTTSIVVGGLTKWKYLNAAINNISAVTGKIGMMRWIGTAISGTSTVTVGMMKRLAGLLAPVHAYGNVSAAEFIRWKFMSAVATVTGGVDALLNKAMKPFDTQINAVSDITSLRSRLVFLGSTVMSSAHSVLVTLMGYASQIQGAVINAVGSAQADRTDVARGITTQIDAVATTSGFLMKDATLNYSTIDATSGVQSLASILVGIMPTTISATSTIMSDPFARSAVFQAMASGWSQVTTGDFIPVSLFSATFDASGGVDAHLIRSTTLTGNVMSVGDVEALMLNRHQLHTAVVNADGNVNGWMSVPEALRQLLITASGVVVRGTENGEISFDLVTSEQLVTIRGITVIQLNDVKTGRYETIIVLE